MQTRAKTRQIVNHARFERTVNLLLYLIAQELNHSKQREVHALRLDANPAELAEMTLQSDDSFTLSEDSFQLGKIEVKTRDNGSLSKPDAELVLANTDTIIIDAKYYTSELS